MGTLHVRRVPSPHRRGQRTSTPAIMTRIIVGGSTNIISMVYSIGLLSQSVTGPVVVVLVQNVESMFLNRTGRNVEVETRSYTIPGVQRRGIDEGDTAAIRYQAYLGAVSVRDGVNPGKQASGRRVIFSCLHRNKDW